MQYASALEAVFLAYRHSTLRDIKNKLALLRGMPKLACMPGSTTRCAEVLTGLRWLPDRGESRGWSR